jgi:tetratricopeptide (TPR) repeat protein
MTGSVPLQHGNSMTYPVATQAAPVTMVPALARQYLAEGVSHIQAGEAGAAVAALSLCVEQAPEYSDAHVFLGIAHALTNNIYPALDHLEEATRLDESSFAAHYTLAQLNFKLRIPQKGYEQAELARQCDMTLEQRKLLTNLLREEKARERSGIARPVFNKPFSVPALFLAGSGLAAAIVTIIRHMH